MGAGKKKKSGAAARVDGRGFRYIPFSDSQLHHKFIKFCADTTFHGLNMIAREFDHHLFRRCV